MVRPAEARDLTGSDGEKATLQNSIQVHVDRISAEMVRPNVMLSMHTYEQEKKAWEKERKRIYPLYAIAFKRKNGCIITEGNCTRENKYVLHEDRAKKKNPLLSPDRNKVCQMIAISSGGRWVYCSHSEYAAYLTVFSQRVLQFSPTEPNRHF